MAIDTCSKCMMVSAGNSTVVRAPEILISTIGNNEQPLDFQATIDSWFGVHHVARICDNCGSHLAWQKHVVHLPPRLAVALEAGSDIPPNLTSLEVRHHRINTREDVTSHYRWISGVYL